MSSIKYIVRVPEDEKEVRVGRYNYALLDVFEQTDTIFGYVGSAKDVWELQKLIASRSGEYGSDVVFEGNAWAVFSGSSWLFRVKMALQDAVEQLQRVLLLKE